MKSYLQIIALPLLILLGGCGDDEKSINNIDDPELVAVAFFHALYNEKDVKKAASVCNPQLARIIMHYKSPRAVARHLFNMSFDSVEISPDSSGVKVREQFKAAAKITGYFDGFYNDDRLKDVKRLSLIQQDGKWIINKILKDPF